MARNVPGQFLLQCPGEREWQILVCLEGGKEGIEGNGSGGALLYPM